MDVFITCTESNSPINTQRRHVLKPKKITNHDYCTVILKNIQYNPVVSYLAGHQTFSTAFSTRKLIHLHFALACDFSWSLKQIQHGSN